MNSGNSLQQDGSSPLEPLCLVWLSSALRSAGITGRPWKISLSRCVSSRISFTAVNLYGTFLVFQLVCS